MEIEKLIERLQNWDGIKPDREIDCAIEGLKALQAENDRLRKEKDAAVELLQGQCEACSHFLECEPEDEPCNSCNHIRFSGGEDHWQWLEAGEVKS